MSMYFDFAPAVASKLTSDKVKRNCYVEINAHAIVQNNVWSNKNLSYCRDGAHRRSLGRSRLFKVTNFDTNRNPVFVSILVNNTNLIPYRTAFQLLRSICQIIAFD